MIQKKDLYLIIIVVGIAAMGAYFLSNSIFSTDAVKADVEVVEKISPEFPEMDKKYFNKDSINPTQLITIGDENSENPFKQQEDTQ